MVNVVSRTVDHVCLVSPSAESKSLSQTIFAERWRSIHSHLTPSPHRDTLQLNFSLWQCGKRLLSDPDRHRKF